MKAKELEHLQTIASSLINDCKAENSKVKVEQVLSEMTENWNDLKTSISNKEQEILARKSKVDQFTVLFVKFSNKLDTMKQQINKPVDLSALDEMTVR